MTIKIRGGGDQWSCRVDPTDTTPVILRVPVAEQVSTIAVKVPAGGSVKIEFSASSPFDLDANDGLFITAEGMAAGGVLTANTLDTVPGPITAVRITASAAGGRVEVLQEAD